MGCLMFWSYFSYFDGWIFLLLCTMVAWSFVHCADAFSLMKVIVWWVMTLNITVSEFHSHSLPRRRITETTFGLVFLFCHWNTCACRRCVLDNTDFLVWYAGHLMEKIEAENLLHRAFSVFLFNSKYELLLQVLSYDQLDVKMTLSFIKTVGWFLDLLASYYVPSYWNFHLLLWTATVKNKGYVPTCVDKYLL